MQSGNWKVTGNTRALYQVRRDGDVCVEGEYRTAGNALGDIQFPGPMARKSRINGRFKFGNGSVGKARGHGEGPHLSP